ncbi:MAG: ABC transporter ATP-binding protein [Candidatus Micrarchaeota archaeon]
MEKEGEKKENALAVKVDGLVKIIGSKIIVDEVSFEVKKGEIFGLLGGNGSGKTTIFNMLSGVIEPSSGEVHVSGYSMRERKKLLHTIGFVTQENTVYETLTVKENLEYFAAEYGAKKGENIKKLLEDVELYEKRDSLAGSLSGGMKRRLNIACSLVHNPELVFLDEPTVGLDPATRRGIWRLVKKLHESGKTVILTSHYMDEVEALCERVVLVFRGRIVAEGSPQELKSRFGLTMDDLFEKFTREGKS